MKKLSVALALGVCWMSGSAHAIDGNINITGTIIDVGCTIDPGDMAQTVPLGSVSKSAFAAAGDVGGSRDFSIRLSACPAIVTSASAVFDGARDIDDARLLAVTGGAVGVGAALFEKDGSTLIPIGNRAASITVVSNAVTLEYVAKYMATTNVAGITGGPASANAQFTIIYN